MNSSNNSSSAEDYIFWDINDKTGSIKILPSKVYELLQAYGLAKYYPDKTGKNTNPVIVLIKENIIEPVGKDFMLSFSKLYINYMVQEEQLNKRILDALHRSTSIFSETNQYLVDAKEVKTIQDTADASYFFFKNSVVKVTTGNIELIPYNNLHGCVWKSNIIDFEITIEDAPEVMKNAVFFRFLSDITRKGTDSDINKKRIAHLFSLIGYLLHRYKSFSEARAVIIMDENPSFSPEGGTGKSLIFKALGKMRNGVTEPGRNFDPSGRFAFQKVDESVDLFLVDDAAANFNFEKLFSHITEDFSIEQKFMTSRIIPFSDAPKIAVTTNYSVNNVGESNTRRKYEFEISAYYRKGFSPETKYGHTFFQQWNNDEWNLFYNLMFLSTQFFIKNGVVASEPLNLKRTHLVNSTCEEFVDYAEEKILLNVEYNKKDLLIHFITLYPEYRNLNARTFNKWLLNLASMYGYKVMERRSNADYFIKYFLGNNSIQPALSS